MPPTKHVWIAIAAAGVALARPVGAEVGIRKGPWLMDLRRDALTVMVERTVPGSVHVRVTPPRPSEADAAVPAPIDVDDAAPLALHEVHVTGLRPGTHYHYEVSGPGLETAAGAFSTPPDDAPFRFVIYGDTRSNANLHRQAVQSILAAAPDFAIHTGDLVADGRREDLWQHFFEIESPLLRNTPWIPVVGNHELVGHGSPGIENFRRYIHVDPSSPNPELDYTFAYGTVRVVVLNAYEDWDAPAFRTWLDTELTRARDAVPDGFLLVAMHWGPCSCGPHGENRRLRAAGIDSLFRARHVDLVISGHDHIYERGDDHGLRYIVSGGGGAELYHAVHPRAYTLAFAAEHHYVRADVERDHILFTAVRLDGTTIDQCALRASGWSCPAPAATAMPTVTTLSPAVAMPATPSRGCAVAPTDLARPEGVSVFACVFAFGFARRRARYRPGSHGIIRDTRC